MNRLIVFSAALFLFAMFAAIDFAPEFAHMASTAEPASPSVRVVETLTATPTVQVAQAQ